MQTFDDFLPSFFTLFTQPQFRGQDFATYLQKLPTRRTNDEASVVDNAIVSPLLALLGYSPGEQMYNQGKRFGRPDFAPETPDYGVCFVVENKSTGLELELDPSDPESHLSQLAGYLRALGLQNGWLVNGARILVWKLNNAASPVLDYEIDIANALPQWNAGGADALDTATVQNLRLLFDQYRRETFADWEQIERHLGMDEDAWEQQALPLGASPQNQELFVGAVQTLLQDLQTDARNRLDTHLQRREDYDKKVNRSTDDPTETAHEQIDRLRESVIGEMRRVAPLVGMEPEELSGFEESLYELERDPFAYLNTRELKEKTLSLINAARERKVGSDRRGSRAWTRWDNGLGALGTALEGFGDATFGWHRKRAFLGYDYRTDIQVFESYNVWKAMVQETMLGGLGDAERRDEFALQASYVVLIRLMLIRVCEDKGILRLRILSDGGIKIWQSQIERYYQFSKGNPYEPLLNMAFENAQNIYAHFFTGRELFNWYTLSRLRFIRVLRQLNRYQFADVDSDLIGTIYNTYVERPEKKQKGQYYTPPEIVRYILDESGYVTGAGIVGPNRRLIDPACGSGTFLVEAARRLVAAYSAAGGTNPRQVIDTVRDTLYGFDLNPFACYLAEVNLLIQVLDLVKTALDGNAPPNLQRFHVYNVDALSPSTGIFYTVRASFLMAEELETVDRIKGRQDEYRQGFRWIVANPPYGASLTETYKASLREWYPTIFHGQPDTYTFFFEMGMRLLADNGRLGFITPNTYLMGTDTAKLREQLLTKGKLTQIVDLPSGIWKDANVDCALLFLQVETDREARRAQTTQVFSMAVRETLDNLTARQWNETFAQPQSVWMDSPAYEMNIRWTPLLTQIEEACRVAINGDGATKLQRLGDVTDSSQGIIPYKTATDGKANLYIKPRSEVPSGEPEWKPLMDSTGFVGRYEMRWGAGRPYLKYGNWLWCERDAKYFNSPKLLVQDMRNRALSRRLVATYDDKQFYNRHNFSNIIGGNAAYDLKYILALFNSSLLNYWFARQYDNVHINPSYFRKLPIYPADVAAQAELVTQVDDLLARHASLNAYREQGYVIRTRRDGTREITIPYDILLRQIQQQDRDFSAYSLFQAQAAGFLRIPEQCDRAAQIKRVFTPNKYPNTVVLRASQFWLEVDDPDLRRYLLNYLDRPQWKGRSWDEISSHALMPEPPEALAAFFAEESRIVAEIAGMLDAVTAADLALDNRILDLYGITHRADRARVLGSAPAAEDAEPETDTEGTAEE